MDPHLFLLLGQLLRTLGQPLRTEESQQHLTGSSLLHNNLDIRPRTAHRSTRFLGPLIPNHTVHLSQAKVASLVAFLLDQLSLLNVPGGGPDMGPQVAGTITTITIDPAAGTLETGIRHAAERIMTELEKESIQHQRSTYMHCTSH